MGDTDDAGRATDRKIRRGVVRTMSNGLLALISLAVIGGWIASGLYHLELGEEAIILRFGTHNRTESREGWNWHLPPPLEYGTPVNVRGVRTVEFGLRPLREDAGPADVDELSLSPEQIQALEEQSAEAETQAQIEQAVRDEAREAAEAGYFIQTNDSNIVNVSFEIQYTIADAYAFYYGMRRPRGILKTATQAAVREVMGKKRIDEVLFTSRNQIELEAQVILEKTLAGYFAERGGESPFEIDKINLQRVHPPAQVQAAFEDVVSAQQDSVRSVSQAKGDSREILERAAAQAAELREQSQAYKDAKIFESSGEASRFEAVLAEYERAPEVTRQRLYLETMESVLPAVQKMIVEPDAVSVMPFMPMPVAAPGAAAAPGAGEKKQ